jgi:hypothetical protein
MLTCVGERVCALGDAPVRAQDFELVVRLVSNAGDEQFEHARSAERAHRIHAPVEMAKITDDTDARRVRRPNRESHAVDVVDRKPASAHDFPEPLVRALAEVVQILLAERREEPVRIIAFPRSRVGKIVLQSIPREPFRKRQDGAEQPCSQRLHRHGGSVFRNAGRAARLGMKGAHEALGIGYRVHAEDRVRLRMASLQQRAQIGFVNCERVGGSSRSVHHRAHETGFSRSRTTTE